MWRGRFVMKWRLAVLGFGMAGCAQPALAQADQDGLVALTDSPQSAPNDRSESTASTSQARGFFAEVELGLEYDSNVVIDDIDLNLGLGDESAELRARLGYETDLGPSTELKLGYRFAQRVYEEFDQFDLQSHTASIAVEHDLGPADLEIDYRFADVALGGDGFVGIHRLSPSLSFYVDRTVLVRAEYAYSDKDFRDRIDRDADKHALGVDLFWLVDRPKTYLVFGYRVADEDARDDQFDFRSHEFRLRLAQRFQLADRRAQLRLGWRYEDRDFKSETLSIGAARRDDRHRLSAELIWEADPSLDVSLEYEYSDFASNLSVADYSQSVIGLSARLKI